ncbi:hypothetical protein BGY98DRAFT_573950 [Russula aff. rugulosa BPL654]|nr:hypothetical protein BGY98DRAFT_573950 [Russula aff. rugulosa BPL654]
MRRYKIVACILLILSVFNSVLAAPVAVQEVREACADAVDASDALIIGSGKRANEEEDPLLAQAQQGSSLRLRPSGWTSLPQGSLPPGLASVLNYVSGTDPNPSFSSEGEAKLIQPGPLTGIQPASSIKAKLIQPGPSTGIQPASSSKAKSVSWAPWKEVKLPSGRIKNTMLVPPRGGTRIKAPVRGTYGYASENKLAAQPLALPPKPQSMNIFSNLVAVTKLWFSKVAGKIKFWR